jgi:hypothetical protein
MPKLPAVSGQDVVKDLTKIGLGFNGKQHTLGNIMPENFRDLTKYVVSKQTLWNIKSGIRI